KFAATMGRLTYMLPSPDDPLRPFQPLADRLKEEASQIKGKDAVSQDIAGMLRSVAEHCERVTASRHDPDKAIAVEIAGRLDAVFGSPKYKTAATIASVIVEHDITERDVRTWYANPAKLRKI